MANIELFASAHGNDPCFRMLLDKQGIICGQDDENFDQHIQYFKDEEKKLGNDEEGKKKLAHLQKIHFSHFEKEAKKLKESQKKEVEEFVEKWYVDQAQYANYEHRLEKKRIVADDTVRRGIQLQYEFENPEKDHDEAWALIVDVTQAALKECRARHALRIKNLSRTK
jgi:hypothetical protein